MKSLKSLNFLVFAILLTLITNSAYAGNKTEKKEKKGSLNHLIVIEGENKIIKALNNPQIMINKPLLKALNKKQGIIINKGSMLKTDKCIGEILATTSHLSKISTGNRVVKIEVEINTDSRISSMFASKKKQTLEFTEVTITFHYNKNNVEPTVVVCTGHSYY